MPPISEWWQFVRTRPFDEDWGALGLDDEEMARLELELVNDPYCGDVIPGTGGLRKLRFAREGVGKSRSVRICYAFFEVHGIVLLTLVYGKSDKKNLTASEKKSFKQLLDRFRKLLEGKEGSK
jgi:hypothetical protein